MSVATILPRDADAISRSDASTMFNKTSARKLSMERTSRGVLGVAVEKLLRIVNVNVAVNVNDTDPNCQPLRPGSPARDFNVTLELLICPLVDFKLARRLPGSPRPDFKVAPGHLICPLVDFKLGERAPEMLPTDE
ncbi:MAG: hypothetical protein WCJ30_01695 [Deltaproteobacteria bacterium]